MTIEERIERLEQKIGIDADIPSWSNGSWDAIKEAHKRHRRGEINLCKHWKVGDKRKVHLSAIEETVYRGGQEEMDVDIVLTHFGENGVIYWQTERVVGYEYINPRATNMGGWEASALRQWLNNVWIECLPSEFKSMLLNNAKNNIAIGKILLPSESQVFGDEADEQDGEQWDYYKNPDNRIKYDIYDEKSWWWLRSPNAGITNYFCRVTNGGYAGTTIASGTYGLAPCGCI